MGMYLNPGNSGFQAIRKQRYVDKSGMLAVINGVIDSKQKLVCISRPRRFGKSFAAQMLCAYYDKTCDSSALFDDLEIANDDHYKEYLNQYDIIYLDMTAVMGESKNIDFISFMTMKITEELALCYPELKVDKISFINTLLNAVEFTGNKFIVIIDEWDAPIREQPQKQKEYLHFLRTLFKNSGTTDQIFAAAYMTGILPIKKDGSQSAISDFKEYTMIDSMEFAAYVGFTEKEVKELCKEYDADFEQMKQWYDGYDLGSAGSIYNANSVMQALQRGRFQSYWTQTSASDSLLEYISMDFDGLSKIVTELIAGIEVEVNTRKFSNDLITFRDKDDVLTLLIHLGYLAYDADTGTVHIPNEEIKQEFADNIRDVKRTDTIQRVRESDQLIYDTIHGNADAVAAQIEKLHAEETAVLFYNNEQALRSVVKLAYFSYKDYYVKFEELPAGEGIADLVYLPKKKEIFPALVIEMKWNKSAEGAIDQIKKKHYPDAIKEFAGEVLLVGINYDKDAPAGERKHTCVIEKLKK